MPEDAAEGPSCSTSVLLPEAAGSTTREAVSDPASVTKSRKTYPSVPSIRTAIQSPDVPVMVSSFPVLYVPRTAEDVLGAARRYTCIPLMLPEEVSLSTVTSAEEAPSVRDRNWEET